MEPLEPLQAAVASEIRRLDIRCGPVTIDPVHGIVVVDDVTSPWGPRTALAAALRRARLHVDVDATHSGYRFCVHAEGGPAGV